MCSGHRSVWTESEVAAVCPELRPEVGEAGDLAARTQSTEGTVLRDFENLEVWLQQAYDTIFHEPSRHLYPP